MPSRSQNKLTVSTSSWAPLELPASALVLLIGASGSGKSTFAARHFPMDVVVSSDQLRGSITGRESDQRRNDTVFQQLHGRVDERLRAGALAVVDATNTDWMGRAELLLIARRYGRPAAAIVLDLPTELCLARNAERDRVVRADVVRRQVADIRRDLDRLDLEGFASVHVLHSAVEVDQARVRLYHGDGGASTGR